MSVFLKPIFKVNWNSYDLISIRTNRNMNDETNSNSKNINENDINNNIKK